MGKRNLPSLDAGQAVRILDQATVKWDRSSVAVGAIPQQHLVRLDGSGRASYKNRKHLCALMEVSTVPPPLDVNPSTDDVPRQHPKSSYWQSRQPDGYILICLINFPDALKFSPFHCLSLEGEV